MGRHERTGAIGLITLLLLLAPAQASPTCQALRDQREQWANQAMRAELVLVHDVRLRLCPQEERQAAEANALNPSPQASPPLNYAAYIQCRQRAEALLQRSRPVLFRNQRGFTYYTPAGAGLARQADALQPQIERSCPQQSSSP